MSPSAPRPSNTSKAEPLELWGGTEPTVNRVGERYFDQTCRTGHHERAEDLDLIASLGVSAVRYPVLWERTAPNGLEHADWRWADRRLGRLRDLGLRPILGLVHHGSGPRHTSLLDPAFADELARYARAVAERYPWIEDYTPVNEPLTTARFSALYGQWYPHAHDDLSFARALLIQCRAVAQAMGSIRQINPRARLLQTDDLGKTYSTPRLAYQASFENERRWLSWDLLCGAVDPRHPMWGFLTWIGVEEAELAWFVDHPCPPDIIGINHYVTSERVLDEHREAYPSDRWGGNGREMYADMEAPRVRAEGIGGWPMLLREAWARYRLPLAISEVHLGGPRDEQLRWLVEAWQTCLALRAEMEVDVRAVTAWSLFGAYDWNHLVTCSHDFYEPGVFDVRSPTPRPTALARLMPQLAQGHIAAHPILETPGWWRRPDRFTVSPLWTEPERPRAVRIGTGRRPQPRPLLITGATGTLGRAFARMCGERGLSYRLLSRRDMDIVDRVGVERVLDATRPWAVVNAAGYVRVDDAEADLGRCMRENADGPSELAAACGAREISLVTFSSDLVFDGAKGSAYVESDRVNPLNVYGRSKVEAEQRVLARHPTALVVRTSAFFGPWDVHNFVHHALRVLSAGDELVAANDAIVSPTYVPDLVHACLDLLIDGEAGIWHLANAGAVSWCELARWTAELAGISPLRLRCCPTTELGLAAPRPAAVALTSERGWIMPALGDALARFLAECEAGWRYEAQPEGVRTTRAA
jgi:dTDP-4-dehydrorhamnose reductase